MTHDPVFFPDPDTFRPERFMGDQAQDVPFADPSQLVFGFGRRYVPCRFLDTPFITTRADNVPDKT